MTLSADQTINLIFSILSLIPAIYIYRNYYTTKILDFLLFSGLYVTSALAGFASVMVASTNALIFYQINNEMINITFLMMMIHGLRIKYKELPKLWTGIGIGYFIILTIIIGFWKVQNQPDTALVLFMQMHASVAPAHPNGAGLMINGVMIYSSSFYILALVFWIYATIILLWSYATVKIANPVPSISKARKIWLIIWALDLIWEFFLLPFTPNFANINLVLLFVDILIIFNIIKYPESTLISDFQLIRAQTLYNRILNFQDDEIEDFGMSSLVEYLQSLPEDLINR